MGNDSTPPSAVPSPSPLGALLLLLALDLGAGIWLKLHHPDGLPIYFLINAPTIGLMSLVWRLLPKRFQEQVGEAMAAALASARGRTILLVVTAGLVVASMFFAAVRVSLADPGATTMVHVVRGTQVAPDSGALARADSFRLDRLTSSVVRVLSVSPSGERIWLYTPSHVLFREVRIWPWIPAGLAYPGDFVPMSTVAILPSAKVMSRVAEHDLSLILRAGATSEVLARAPLDTVGTLVGFVRPGPLLAEDTARWGVSLDPGGRLAADTTFPAIRRFILDRWRRSSWVRSARPLRLGDTLTWEVRSLKDSAMVESGRLTLDARMADLHLSF